ncbi:hypothetical protein BMETH_2175_0 [methanotrophic bacterial endosymbiont of Bathymodiolus sp.]|nr:hypothetical protein BMETH_2175_0 [methanotrophic bacterial endosymbiont of Bathymodiolus sp.]
MSLSHFNGAISRLLKHKGSLLIQFDLCAQIEFFNFNYRIFFSSLQSR